eukprot:CAMPEP_0198218856 /NCGR_PEP_ID=MMETSP1445-20131203/71497_1 /TAXON_ID=36898 /ORGANISM="Pyramimonas sp., Strain CCMP2087" /LENGTH=158 /DNA_ID=CAMNT_0043896079 /DNA_START=211 /DNA_END=687 /DNA_ORIENTATION=-
MSRRSIFASLYAAGGAWLVEHPAPLWLVNNPVKRWVAEKSAGEYDAAAVSSKLADLLAGDDIVVFSATYCPFSLAAKRALAAEGVAFKVYETNTMEDGGPIVAELGKLTGRTSIPHIFIGGESVGGCNDGTPGIRPLIASGGLPAALAEASRRNSAGL